MPCAYHKFYLSEAALCRVPNDIIVSCDANHQSIKGFFNSLNTVIYIKFLINLRLEEFNNNNKHFFNLQVVNSPSRLRFEANLSKESSECTEHSHDQTSQINTGKTVYEGNA